MAKFVLAQVCRRKKMTQYRLAILLKMDGKNIARLFRPGYDPKLSVLNRLAKVLRVKVRDLLKE